MATWHKKAEHSSHFESIDTPRKYLYPSQPVAEIGHLGNQRIGQGVKTVSSKGVSMVSDVTVYHQGTGLYYGDDHLFYTLEPNDTGYFYCPYIPLMRCPPVVYTRVQIWILNVQNAIRESISWMFNIPMQLLYNHAPEGDDTPMVDVVTGEVRSDEQAPYPTIITRYHSHPLPPTPPPPRTVRY